MSFFDNVMGRVHSACDKIFAQDAVLRPAAGGAFPCKAEVFLPEPEFGLTDAKTVVPDIVLRVVKAGLPDQPKRGDVFEIGAVDYRVLAKPTTEDDDGMRWTIQVERVTA